MDDTDSNLPYRVAESLARLRDYLSNPVPCILTIMFDYDSNGVFSRVIFTGSKEEDDNTARQLEEKYFPRLF